MCNDMLGNKFFGKLVTKKLDQKAHYEVKQKRKKKMLTTLALCCSSADVHWMKTITGCRLHHSRWLSGGVEDKG